MMRLIYLLALAAALLTACAMSPTSPDSFYRCDRNGEREQRVACASPSSRSSSWPNGR